MRLAEEVDAYLRLLPQPDPESYIPEQREMAGLPREAVRRRNAGAEVARRRAVPVPAPARPTRRPSALVAWWAACCLRLGGGGR